MQKTRFYFVRHGETDWNVQRIRQGQTDVPLNTKGEGQALLLRTKYKDINFDTIFSSDLSRAKRTAEIFNELQRLPHHISVLLRERSWGIHEGSKKDTIKEINREKIDAYKKLSKSVQWQTRMLAEAESHKEVYDRVYRFLEEAHAAHAGATILVVTHADPIRTLLYRSEMVDQNSLPSGSIGHTCEIIVDFDGKNTQIVDVRGIDTGSEQEVS